MIVWHIYSCVCAKLLTVCSHLKEELTASQIFGQDIQHPHHLGKDENSVSSLLQANQQFVQQDQLTAAADQLLSEKRRVEQFSDFTSSVQSNELRGCLLTVHFPPPILKYTLSV